MTDNNSGINQSINLVDDPLYNIDIDFMLLDVGYLVSLYTMRPSSLEGPQLNRAADEFFPLRLC
jgi:hypothetical protein